MIELKKLTARARGNEVLDVTHELRAGRHALLGTTADGVSALLSCIAGETRPKRGAITVLGSAPWSSSVRARVGFVPLGVRLPDVLRVSETISVARSIRKNAPIDAASALAPLGIDALVDRRVDTLDASEVRAVALAEALASPSVSVVLIEEPFVSMAAPAAAALSKALVAKKNACIVISTASSEDASLLADDFLFFEKGKLARVTNDVRGAKRDKPRIRIVADDTRALAAELSKKTEITRLELAESGLLVEGADALELASAVNAAIADARVDVRRMERAP